MSKARAMREVAQVFISPKVFERTMNGAQIQAVEELVDTFNERMAGMPLFVGAQALGMLTADFCTQISAKGGDSICALQDVAARGQDWISAGDAAKAVMVKAGARVKRRRKVT